MDFVAQRRDAGAGPLAPQTYNPKPFWTISLRPGSGELGRCRILEPASTFSSR